MKITIPLDDTDIRILTILQEGGSGASTRELSNQLSIPDRTVRYRLKKMRDKGVLCPPKVQTYERKLGLGESLILFQADPGKEEQLAAVIEDTPCFYYYSSTYGKYDGFSVYSMYPLVAPRMIIQMAEEMRDRGLVKDFFIFDLVDYTRKGAEVLPLLPESDWNWEVWSEEIKHIMEEGCELDLGLEAFPKTVKFDYKDIQIVKHMVENPGSTLKEVGKQLDLSLTQIHKRVRRLEDTGIVRGVKPAFSPYEETIMISCFFKSREHAKKILCGFHKLPFAINIAMENDVKYNVGVSIPPSETNQFLQRIGILRKYAEEFFIQIVLKGKSKGYTHLLTAYNRNTQSWETPDGGMMKRIRELTP